MSRSPSSTTGKGLHMIHSQRDARSHLTTHTVEGSVTAEQIRGVIEVFHVENPTLHVLWDFRQADVTHISTGDIERLVDEVRRHAHTREGGKTALVFSHDLWYGQGRMFQAYAELRDLPVEFYCCRHMEEALEWLGIGQTP